MTQTQLQDALHKTLEREGLSADDIRWQAFYNPCNRFNLPPEFTFMGEHIPFKTPTLYAWTGDWIFRVDGDADCTKRKSYEDYPVLFIEHASYNPFVGKTHNFTFSVPIPNWKGGK